MNADIRVADTRLSVGNKIDSGRVLLPGHGESVTPLDEPRSSTLRRSWMWVSHPFNDPCVRRVAFHEAGHAVYAEWLGLSVQSISATPVSGLTQLDLGALTQCPSGEQEPDEPPKLMAEAVALFHAGTCAEWLFMGEPWRGPVLRLEQRDHQTAEMMLSTVFGSHHSGAHAYAQLMALHVLSHHWHRVRETAERLVSSLGESPKG